MLSECFETSFLSNYVSDSFKRDVFQHLPEAMQTSVLDFFVWFEVRHIP